MMSVINLSVFILLFLQLCSCCTQQERNSLLKFDTIFKGFYLANETSEDCCNWKVVECDRTTHRRVIRLNLKDTYRYDDEDVNASGTHVLNASLFLPFQQLQHLDLSWNGISDLHNFQDLARLKKLRVLLLRGTGFYNTSLLEPLFTLASLTVLDLSDNRINASFSDFGRGICKMKNLRELILSENMISGSIPECFRNLTSLKSLDLSDNNLVGNLDLRTLSTSLEFLSVRDNNHLQFNANMFSSPMSHKFQFRHLDLSNCKLNVSTSELVTFVSNQPNLIALDLSNNNLHGNFPTSVFKNNTQLRFLSLRNNSFTGHIFSFGSLNLLEYFDISYNHIQGELQSNIGQVLHKLKYFSIAKNNFQGGIPVSLGDIKDLEILDLSNNNLSGKLPEGMGLSFQRIGNILLSNNKLEGQIPDTIFNLTNLYMLDLSNNQFTGYIPNNQFRSFELELLNISQNHISGRIPSWLGTNLTNSLVALDMHDNSIEGSLRPKLCNLRNLEYLHLSQNKLSGLVPSCLATMPSLRYLRLQRNKLTHLISNVEPLSTSNLWIFDLSHNNLSGKIPNWFGILENVGVLLLKGNHFRGSIPHELCHLSKMGILDLSHNDLAGSVPLCFTNITFGKNTFYGPEEFGRLRYLYLENILVTKTISDLIIQPRWNLFFELSKASKYREDVEFLMKSRLNIYEGGIIIYMSGMDLSCNNFKGNIPLDIGDLTGIRALNLSHNQFTGSIPSSLSNMKQIESIDFSYNKLSGEIPSSLTRLTTLVVFNVAYNNLSGRVPDMVAQFSTFNETSYEGNPFLCGPTLPGKRCNIDANGSRKSDTHDGQNDMHMIDLNSFLESFAITYVACLMGFVIVLYVNSYWQQRWFHFIDTCTSFLFSFCRSGP